VLGTNGPMRHVVFRDNILAWNTYGIFCATGQITKDCFVNWSEAKNVIINNSPGNVTTQDIISVFPNSLAVNASSNPLWVGPLDDRSIQNWKLKTNSPYRKAATDGKDIGVDIDLLVEALGLSTNTPRNASGNAPGQ